MCIILRICLNVISDNLKELSRNMNWLNWLCIDFVIEWLWVQTFLRMKLTFFLPKFHLAWTWKGKGTLAAKRGSLMGERHSVNGYWITIKPILINFHFRSKGWLRETLTLREKGIKGGIRTAFSWCKRERFRDIKTCFWKSGS